jgi:hypothetical protein
MLPALKELVDSRKIPRLIERFLLLLQDNNTRAHHGKDYKPTTICRVAKEEFGLKMAPKDPPQPALSPDLSLLDTFFFRILFIKFRRLRAQARVKEAAQEFHKRVEQVEENDEKEKRGNFNDYLHD